MLSPDYKILSFEEYITEKSGIIERNLYTEIDSTELSKIINRFMRHIIMKPKNEYVIHENVFNKLITIKYKPSIKPKNNGSTGKNIIYIYREVNDSNYLDVKYTLAHEMVHLIHQILSKNNIPYEDLDELGKLRYDLVKITSENIESYKKSKNLTDLLYLIDTNEVFSRNQNAYIEAFKYKKENSEILNQEIVNFVLDKIKMTKEYLDKSLIELKTDKSAFSIVISFLIGNFNELGKSGYQQFFDKSIYQIQTVKKMRKDIKKSIHNVFYIDEMRQNALNVINEYMDDLYQYKEENMESFIEHMKYWFNEAQKRIGKAIQLGIDDAIETIKLN